MKPLFFLKTQLWPNFKNSFKPRRKGSSTLMTAFIFVIFSTLGISMLSVTQIYLKSNAYKKHDLIMGYASENGIKQAFHQFMESLSRLSTPIPLSLQKFHSLKADSLNKGTQAVEMLLQTDFPITFSQSWKKMSWKSQLDFIFQQMEETKDYFKVEYTTQIKSVGQIKHFSPKKESELEGNTILLVGHLPLHSFPLLIDKPLNLKQRETFLQENNITLVPEDRPPVPPQPHFSQGELLPQQAHSQLSQALKTKIFYPQKLSPLKLRRVLGLELIDEPVPEGVYLIKDDLGLGGVFVQGDVQEMILAIQGMYQLISFQTKRGQWILKFSPSERKTLFSSPENTSTYDLVPLGIIIVNGKISSLGGGIAEASGQISLVKKKEIPCILQGVKLSIISSDKITLSSHLIQQGAQWREGIPYLKDSTSQLMIFATGKDFLDDSRKSGEIIIGKDSSQKLHLHASLTASGKGFTIEGKEKNVHLLGNLHTSNFEGKGNQLNFRFDDRALKDETWIENTPKTSKPVLHFSSFQLRHWNEL